MWVHKSFWEKRKRKNVDDFFLSYMFFQVKWHDILNTSLFLEYWLMEWCFLFPFFPGILTAVITIYNIGDWTIHLLQLIIVFYVHMCKFFFLNYIFMPLADAVRNSLLIRGEIVCSYYCIMVCRAPCLYNWFVGKLTIRVLIFV